MAGEKERRLVVGVAVLAEGGIGLFALALGTWLGQPRPESFRWDAGDAALGAAACVPMLLLFLLILWAPVGPLKGLKQVAVDFIKPLFAPCTLFDLAVISLLAGVGEELLFRGVLQGALCEGLEPWAGVLTAGLVFGALHLITWTYGLFATLIGVYLGWLWALNGNLLVVMIAHGLYDWVALVVLVRGGSRLTPFTKKKSGPR